VRFFSRAPSFILFQVIDDIIEITIIEEEH
jgi:hypothetical protein